jgi:hypothetical protein
MNRMYISEIRKSTMLAQVGRNSLAHPRCSLYSPEFQEDQTSRFFMVFSWDSTA